MAEIGTQVINGDTFPAGPVGNVTFVDELQGGSPRPTGPLSESASQVADLIDFYPADFAGSRYDPDRNVLVIRVATDAARHLLVKHGLADNPNLEVQESSTSFRQLQDEFRAYIQKSELATRYGSWSVTPDGTGINISVRGGMTEDEARALDEATSMPIYVRPSDLVGVPTTTENHRDDPSPYAGGVRIAAVKPGTSFNDDEWDGCTSAFGQLTGGKDYVLTAGHCFPKDTNKTQLRQYDNGGPWIEYMGDFGSKTTTLKNIGTRLTGADNDYHGDLALVVVSDRGNSVGSKMWYTLNAKKDVVVRTAPDEGLYVCRFGSTTGEMCTLQIFETNTEMQVDMNGDLIAESTFINIDLAYKTGPQYCSYYGDSGGPVYLAYGQDGVQAVGVILGTAQTQTGCLLLFTGVEEAIQAWGGDLDFS